MLPVTQAAMPFDARLNLGAPARDPQPEGDARSARAPCAVLPQLPQLPQPPLGAAGAANPRSMAAGVLSLNDTPNSQVPGLLRGPAGWHATSASAVSPLSSPSLTPASVSAHLLGVRVPTAFHSAPSLCAPRLGHRTSFSINISQQEVQGIPPTQGAPAASIGYLLNDVETDNRSNTACLSPLGTFSDRSMNSSKSSSTTRVSNGYSNKSSPVSLTPELQAKRMLDDLGPEITLRDYTTVVRNAETEVLSIDTNKQSKALVQLAEQNRERVKQVFSLLWLTENCEPYPSNYVRRSKLFAQYARCCVQNGLKPLSQTSLGKLIRIMFPNLTTRRLGIRGQSKYHYCGLRLKNSHPDIDNSKYSNSDCSKDSELTNKSNGGSPNGDVLDGTEMSLTYNSDTPRVRFTDSIINLLFKARSDDPSKFEPLKFASIDMEKLPENTDHDIVLSLESLYQVYCNAIFESIQYLKFDNLDKSLSISNPVLISPQMYNLLITEEICDWALKCDKTLHVALLHHFSNLITKYSKVSEDVLERLVELGTIYNEKSANAVVDLPTYMIVKKKKIVHTFTILLREIISIIKLCQRFENSMQNSKSSSFLDEWDKFVDLDWSTLDILYDERIDGVVPEIKGFFHFRFKSFLSELDNGNSPLKSIQYLLKSLMRLLSKCQGSCAYDVTNIFTRMLNEKIGEILTESTQNTNSWIFLNKSMERIVFLCLGIAKFQSASIR